MSRHHRLNPGHQRLNTGMQKVATETKVSRTEIQAGEVTPSSPFTPVHPPTFSLLIRHSPSTPKSLSGNKAKPQCHRAQQPNNQLLLQPFFLSSLRSPLRFTVAPT